MDWNSFIQLISNVGFPIAACGYMAYMNHKQGADFAAKADKMTDTIAANTVAFNHLTDTIINIVEKGE